MQEYIYADEDNGYDLRLDELRKRRRIVEYKKKRRRKQLARFFLAWTFVLISAALIIFGVVKLTGAAISLFSGNDTVQGDGNTQLPVNGGGSGSQGSDSADPPVDADNEGTQDGENPGDGNDKTGVKDGQDSAAGIGVGGKGLVIIDAGHGGYDGGTNNGDILEKNMTLDISFLLQTELESRGYSTYMTRTEDVFVGLSKRAELANQYPEALAFISVHINAVEDAPSVNGVEAWTVERGRCGELAALLSAEVAASTGAVDRGEGYKKALVVCRDTTMPAAIIECGYITNEEELANMLDNDYQLLIVEGIANGLEEFLKEE